MPDPLAGRAATLVVATGHDLSLALVAGARLVAEQHEMLDRGHAEALMPAVRALLAGRPAPAAILVETGPGSFTGLRVGIAAARALGLAWKVPVHGIGSSQLVAAEARARGATGMLGVALLAPRGQVWFEAFDGLRALAEPIALDPADFLAQARRFPGTLTGSAAVAHGIGGPETTPRAAAAAFLAGAGLGPPAPRYVRAAPVGKAA